MERRRVSRSPRPSLEEIRSLLLPFLRERGVLKAIVFGSYARGTQGPKTDLDLAVVMNTSKRFLERSGDLRGIEEVLRGVPVELLVYAPGELESILHRPFVRDMVAKGVVIYER